MLGITVKAVALVVFHAKLMICPAAVTKGVAAKPVTVGADDPPLPLLPPVPPLPLLPPLPLPVPELEDPPPHATNKLNDTTAATNHALRRRNIVCEIPREPLGLILQNLRFSFSRPSCSGALWATEVVFCWVADTHIWGAPF